ncbi:glucosaminidase domain-containing protein [Teredinibacter waterburyi]|jgi:Uncharacterized FlgJ-related protein|uniref:glucosaminidase domain-containing protein n=1 Tax=Teredinibacter waterburyi TaxID=1500538 RepID=UPI001FEAABB7|nr:glucosaminidase domain-containing protein [Teredinibacter waterburyi]
MLLKKLIAWTLVSYLLFLLLAILHFASWRDHQREHRNPTPPDFRALTDIPTKKDAFFSYLRPLIAQNNAWLSRRRAEVLDLSNTWQTNGKLSHREHKQLEHLAKAFYVKKIEDTDSALMTLRLRVDQIPEALVLAQAANESAWGTSRFARTANNYFGHWCYKKGCGIVPKKRSTNDKHEVRKFDSVAESVQAYFMNINTHSGYRKLRSLRANLHKQNKPLTAKALIPGLINYSQRGEAYMEELDAMIRVNNLE